MRSFITTVALKYLVHNMGRVVQYVIHTLKQILEYYLGICLSIVSNIVYN